VGHVTSGAHSTSTAVFGSKTKDSTRYDMIWEELALRYGVNPHSRRTEYLLSYTRTLIDVTSWPVVAACNPNRTRRTNWWDAKKPRLILSSRASFITYDGLKRRLSCCGGWDDEEENGGVKP
jgi:hypothetical protein